MPASRPAATLAVRVRPRAGRTAILGRRTDGSLEVALRAAPEAGRANAELVALLARALAVPAPAVAIIRGASAREKLVRVAGCDPGALARLGAPAPGAAPAPRAKKPGTMSERKR